jgi:rod shape-determining protein MreC
MLTVGWMLFLGQPTATATRLRAFFVRLGTPLVRATHWIPTVKNRRELQAVNRRLTAENDALRERHRSLLEAERQNERLQQLLSFHPPPGVAAVAAHVIGRDAANWWQSLQLDRGLNDGVRPDLPVVTGHGLVGRVITATRGECRVLLLLDPGCTVSALLQRSRAPGIVRGLAPTLARRPQCLLTFVDPRTPVEVGDQVITSGLGGLFPKGLVIGSVLRAELNRDNSMYQEIEVTPAVDFLRLEEVLILVPTLP